jgi:hypothetical protein
VSPIDCQAAAPHLMGRQLQLATTEADEVELLRFIRSRAPIRVFQSFAPSTAGLWIDDWETRKIPAAWFRIWPQTFPWSPEYGQTGGRECRPESAGQFYIVNAHTAPVFEFSRSFLDKHSYGRIYWARGFSAPHGLEYDAGAFARLTDSVWRWIRKVSHRVADAGTHSPYFLPDAWSRYGQVAAYHAAEKKAHDDLVERNLKYAVEVLGARIVKKKVGS